MGEVIFARPRHNYESYADLYRLIELSGFSMVFIDQIHEESDHTYILTILNGEVTGWPNAKARIILYDLEYHLDGVPAIPGVAEMWAGDAWYARRIGARYVPMGSHEGLFIYGPDGVEVVPGLQYDLAFLAYIIPRRQQVLTQLQAVGLRVSPTSAWGEARDKILFHSRAYLHVHQHDNAPTIAPLRMVVAAAYGLPVISETVADAGMFNRHVLLTADHPHIPLMAATWMVGKHNAAELRDRGQALNQLLCHDWTFRQSIEAAL